MFCPTVTVWIPGGCASGSATRPGYNFVNFVKLQEKNNIEILLHWTYWTEKHLFCRQSNTAKGAERWPDSWNYWVLKKLDIHSRATKNMLSWQLCCHFLFLIFSAFLVLISFPVSLHNLHMCLTNPCALHSVSWFLHCLQLLGLHSGSTLHQKAEIHLKYLHVKYWKLNKIQKNLSGEQVFGFNVPQTTCVMIRSVWTHRSRQTVKQSDQGLYCLPFCLHLLDTLLFGKATLLKF